MRQIRKPQRRLRTFKLRALSQGFALRLSFCHRIRSSSPLDSINCTNIFFKRRCVAELEFTQTLCLSHHRYRWWILLPSASTLYTERLLRQDTDELDLYLAYQLHYARSIESVQYVHFQVRGVRVILITTSPELIYLTSPPVETLHRTIPSPRNGRRHLVVCLVRASNRIHAKLHDPSRQWLRLQLFQSLDGL